MSKFGLGLSLTLFLTSFAPSAVAAGPFCLVSNTGLQNCHYFSLQACQQAAGTLGGMCATNPQGQRQQAQPAVTKIEQPDVVGVMQRGYAAGAEQRRQREEHEARMRLLQAQTRQIEAAPPPQPVAAAPNTLYRCTTAEGIPLYTARPMEGLPCGVVSTYRPVAPSAPVYSAQPRSYRGYRCTKDCSGHEAGYAWAEQNGVDHPDNCGGNSQSFIEGCQAYAEEQRAGQMHVNEDGEECDPDYDKDCLPEDEW